MIIDYIILDEPFSPHFLTSLLRYILVYELHPIPENVVVSAFHLSKNYKYFTSAF